MKHSIKSFTRSLFLATTVGLTSLATTILPVTALGITTVSLTGCAVSAAQVAADGQKLNTGLLNIATIEAITNPQVAANIRTAAQAVLVATANWTTGSPANDIFSALEGASLAIAGIDPNSELGQLAAVAYAIITTIQLLLPAPTASVNAVKVVTVSPYAGKVKIRHIPGFSRTEEFKLAWNKVVAKYPDLASAKLY